MNFQSLMQKINNLGIDSKILIGHTMDDYLKDFPFFVCQYEEKWLVFSLERGKIYNKKEFYSEEEACKYIYNSVINNLSSWQRGYGIKGKT